ncbi:MAG: hypothetical protein M1838_005534 [Thelocarpon superellum]|nr:MAG: hypothetical protein M1838_005534 [Thelocarpon superellum]
MEASKYADPPPPPTQKEGVKEQQNGASSHNLNPTSAAFEPTPTYLEVGQDDIVDEFAQTRAPDDLFDDDFTPVAEPISQPVPPPAPRGRGGHAPRESSERGTAGRGRGGRREAAPVVPSDESKEGAAPATAAKDEVRPGAVKGDRSGTGGVKKPKLSEDELSARLASIKLKNAAREEAHRRAEADEASFQQRERQEQAKRKEERQNRQVMEGERERNRLRKMKAVQGREWDAEKKDEDQVGGRGSTGSQFRRGAYGGVVGGGVSNHDGPAENERGGYAARGPGGRGDRGIGRGRGRGGRFAGSPHQAHHTQTSAPDTKAEADFPALPATKPAGAPSESAAAAETTKPTQPTQPAPTPESKPTEPQTATRGDTPKPAEGPLVSPSGADPSTTWADQMETGTPSATPA